MGNLTDILGAGWCSKEPAHSKIVSDPLGEFESALKSFGLIPDDITPDNKIRRCGVVDKAKSSRGWYVLSCDISSGVYYGAFGDWVDSDSKQVWASNNYQALNVFDKAKCDAQIAAQKRLIEEQTKQKHDDAKQEANSYLNSLPFAKSHAYAEKKGVKIKGVYFDESKKALIVPIRNNKNEFVGYQEIHEAGFKKISTGCQKKGNYFQIGERLTDPLIICEGWATGASIHEATGKTVIVAFDAGNLVSVAKSLRKLTQAQIIFAADNDHGKEKNAGIEAAQSASADIDHSRVIYPKDLNGSDFNDLHQEKGIDEVSKALGIIPGVPIVEWIDAMNAPGYEPVDFVVDDFLVSGTYSILWGVDGTGKSLLVQSLAMCVATGMDWAGRTVKKGAVLYVMGEGHPDMQNRISAWRKHNEKEDENFNLFYSAHGMDLTDAVQHAELYAQIERIEETRGEKVTLLVVDTLSTNFGTGSEKDDADARAFVKPLIKLANQTGVAVLLVHHSNKNGEGGASGSRLFQGDAYTKLEVTRKKENIFLTTHKIKSGPEPGKQNFEFLPIDLGVGPDHKGRMLPRISPVCSFKGADDLEEFGANLLANHYANSGEKDQNSRSKNLDLVLSAVVKVAKNQAANQPNRDDYLILKSDVFDLLPEQIIDKSNRSRAVNSLIEKGVFEKIGAGKHEQFRINSEQLIQ